MKKNPAYPEIRFGFFTLSGLNKFVNVNGEGISFLIKKNNKTYDRFFHNVGMPDQNPSIHKNHIDNLSYCDKISLKACSFNPFYASYSLFDNRFEWMEYSGSILLKAQIKDEAIFKKEGNSLSVSGVEFAKPVTGDLRIIISDDPVSVSDFDKTFARVKSDIPDTAFDMQRPETLSLFSAFYNLTVSDKLKHRYYVPVNKPWVGMINNAFGIDDALDGPMIFAWDASFSSIILARNDTDIAKANLLSTFEGQTRDGRIPQLRLGDRISNRTNPPIWFIAAKEIYDLSGDRDFIASIYDNLLSNYLWFKENRANPDGTFSWGTDNEDDCGLIRLCGKIGAMMESGLDDSPIFDIMNMRDNKLDFACIDLSSLIYRAAEIMMEFAQIIGRDISQFADDLKLYSGAFKKFFDYESGTANSFKDTGNNRVFAREITPLSFYPLLASFAGKREVSLLEDLFYSSHFNGKIPSLSFNSGHFNGDGDYWRGRIWPPMVYLSASGFKRYKSPVYNKIKEWGFQVLLEEWKRHGHIHENYSSVTESGEPKDGVYARSCPLYSWGGLLGIL
jgi:hypothetical protein